MLSPKETGVLPGSRLYWGTTKASTQKLFYYINHCGHYFCERGYKIRRNYMENLLLMLIEKGSMHIDYRDQSYTAQAGDIVLMDCTFPQYYGTCDYVEFYWLHVAGCNAFELCNHLTRMHGSILHHTAPSDPAAALIRSLLSQFSTNQAVGDAEQSRILYNILCRLIAGAQSTPLSETKEPVQKAVALIQRHLGEDLSLKRLSAAVHLSTSQLIRLFRAEMQHSPHEYIVLMRIDRAKHLLKTTSLPIKSIAAEIGYKTESSFTAAFTDRVGLSPRRFRELPLG